MKSRGFSQTPQDMMGEYDGCSVAQYTAYPLSGCLEGQFDVDLVQVSRYEHSDLTYDCTEKTAMCTGSFFLIKIADLVER